jgi:phosphate-selective porin OprO and OprP
MILFSKRKMLNSILFTIPFILLISLCFSLRAEESNDLEERVAKLEKQLKMADKKQLKSPTHRLLISSSEETEEEKNLRTVYDDGFYLKGKDDSLKIGGWLQTGYRAIDKADIGESEFYVRRARLDIRGVLEDDWGYRLYGAFEGSSAKLQEGWLEYRWGGPLRIRLGQIKPPYSLESSYSARWTPLIERSLATTNLVPSEDMGLMIFGHQFNKKITYALSVHNGTGKNTSDNNSNKEVSGRLTLSPLRGEGSSALEGMTLGASVTRARVDGSLSGSSYKTASRVSIVTIPSNVSQQGTLLRYGTELEWLFKQFKLMSEYLVLKRNHVLSGAIDRTVTTRSWYVTGCYLLSGEKEVSNKPAKPDLPVGKNFEGTGAWELVARYEGMKTTAQAFDDGVISGARDVKSTTLGVNWWPNKHIRGAVNLVRTDFGENLSFGDLSRDYESALITQFQFNF